MSDPVVEALILDLLEWVRKEERIYEDVMDAWRTSCPKLPVWEDANDRGLVEQQWRDGRCVVRITDAGRARIWKPNVPPWRRIRGLRFSNQAVVVGVSRGRGSGGQIQLGKDVAEVPGNRLFADLQLARDFPIGEASGD